MAQKRKIENQLKADVFLPRYQTVEEERTVNRTAIDEDGNRVFYEETQTVEVQTEADEQVHLPGTLNRREPQSVIVDKELVDEWKDKAGLKDLIEENAVRVMPA